MQLEPIGYSRQNWKSLLVDTSASFKPVARAVNSAAARGIDVALFNFPLCAVLAAYRRCAPVPRQCDDKGDRDAEIAWVDVT